MAVNDKIRTPDYNDIQSALATVMSAGSGTYGWGQTMKSSQVNVGNTVSINEWGNLRYDIINAYKHVYGSTPTTVEAKEGFKVRYSNTFVPDTGPTLAHQPPIYPGDAVQTNTDQPITQYSTYVANITADRFLVGSGQYATTAATSTSTTWPHATYGSYWTSKIQCTVTVSWANANQARYFFNSGGQIRFAASRSGGATSSQNTSWSSILSTAGTREFGGNNPGTGTTPADCTNWYRLTSSYNPWYTINGSSPYGSNQYRISARCPVSNNSSGSATSAEFLLEFFDNYVDPGNTGAQGTYPGDSPNTIDLVDGTFTVSVSAKYATGVLVPSGLGNFTVTNPTISVGTISP